jgi:hypothetical protein
MHEELSSTNPGETISNTVVNAAGISPLSRRTMQKTDISSTTVNSVVTNRGPRMEVEM